VTFPPEESHFTGIQTTTAISTTNTTTRHHPLWENPEWPIVNPAHGASLMMWEGHFAWVPLEGEFGIPSRVLGWLPPGLE
jgi:hypothetical protein